MTDQQTITKGAVLGAGLLAAIVVAAFVFVSTPARDVTLITSETPADTAAINQARKLQKSGDWASANADLKLYVADGHPTAMYFMSEAYRRGWGVDRDLDRARELLLRAVQYRFKYRAASAYELGRIFQTALGKDCDEIAVAWFTKAVNWGHAKSHVQLAKHYQQGRGVEPDLERAAEHYRLAASAGYESATIRFAQSLATGAGSTPQNLHLARSLTDPAMEALRIKAAQGSGSAAKFLGRIYRDGDVALLNLATAEDWFRRSAQLGDAGGMHELAKLLLSNSNKPEDHQEALGWLRQAAVLGHGGAMTTLGRLHLVGEHGLEVAGAVGWFERGVAVGHPGAMEELARLCAEGEMVKKNIPGAIELAQRGASQGHLGSKTLLSELLAQPQTSTREG